MTRQACLPYILLLATTLAGCGGPSDRPATDASAKSVEIDDEVRAANQEVMRDIEQFQKEMNADLLEMDEDFAAEMNESDLRAAEDKHKHSARKRQVDGTTQTANSSKSDATVANEPVSTPPKLKQDNASPRIQVNDQEAVLPAKRADVREHVRDLRDVDKEVRIAACKRIAELGPAGVDATKTLTDCADDEEAEVRNAAVSGATLNRAN